MSLSATLQGVSGSVNLTVTPTVLAAVEISPTDPSVAKGLTVQLAATGIFSDGSSTLSPGIRFAAVSWIDTSGVLWLFGGRGETAGTRAL